mgnify:CR=1 FL=1
MPSVLRDLAWIREKTAARWDKLLRAGQLAEQDVARLRAHAGGASDKEGIQKALQSFVTEVFWDEPDVLLLDLPPGTGDVQLTLAQLLPGAHVVVVTTPQLTAQRVARRAAAVRSTRFRVRCYSMNWLSRITSHNSRCTGHESPGGIF